MGSRYGGLKQIEPLGPNGETIIDYSVFDAIRAGFGRLVFVIRRDIERPFREIVGARFESRLPVDYVFQELSRTPAGFQVPSSRTKPWGTGHAVLMGADAIREPFAVINGDDFYGRHSYEMLAAQLASGSGDCAMVAFVLRNTLSEFGSVSRGVCRASADSCLESVTELTRIEPDGPNAKFVDASGAVQPLPGDTLVSLNMWGFTPEFFAPLRRQFAEFLQARGQDDRAEFFLPTVVSSLVASGEIKVKILRTPDSWFGITYREDRSRVSENLRQLIAQGDYPSPLA